MTRNKKTPFVPILALFILLILAACGGNTDEPGSGSDKPDSNPPAPSSPPSAQSPPSSSQTPVQETESESSEEEKNENTFAEALLETMTIEEKIGQLFVCGFQNEGVEFTDGMARTMAQFKPAGIILFAEKIGTQEQVAAMTEAFKSRSNIPLFVGVDEEGGQVSRIGALFEKEIGAAGATQSADEATKRGIEIGRRLRVLGFNMNFAPVADVNSNPQNTVIGDRAFSSDPDTAAEYVAAFIEGMQSENVLAVIKHFPGHGDTNEDSHEGIAVFKHDRQRLNEIELKPFIAGIEAGTDAVMVGHISAPQITGDDIPASISKVMITDILRGELGYQGLVITDAMNMGAIANYYSSGEAAVAAVQAGVDIILMPEDMEEAYNAVMAAYENGVLTDARINESVLRVLRVKEKLSAAD